MDTDAFIAYANRTSPITQGVEGRVTVITSASAMQTEAASKSSALNFLAWPLVASALGHLFLYRYSFQPSLSHRL